MVYRYGFNAGSALVAYASQDRSLLTALCGVNTTLAAGAAGIAALFAHLLILERTTGEPFFDLKFAMNGVLAGLASITSGCGVVEPWSAVIIGAVAGLIYVFGTGLLVRLRLDDAVDAIPVHMTNGIWALISVGLFASPSRLEVAYGNEFRHVGWFYSLRNHSGDAHLLGAQTVGVLFIGAWVIGIMLPFFVWLDWKGW